MKQIEKIKWGGLCVYLLTLFGLIFTWSFKTPYMNDDLYFANAKWSSLISLGVNDYFWSNGRFFGQTFTRFVLSKGILFSSLCTAFLFIALLIILFYLSKSITKNKIYPSRIIAITVMVFLFTPSFGSVFLWRAGVGNYLAMAVMELLFLLLIYHPVANKSLNYILVVILGFIAGWGNENTSGAIILICILLLAKSYMQNRKISVASVLGTVSAIIGFVFLLLSPGSQIRLRVSVSGYSQLSTFAKLRRGIGMFIDYFTDTFALSVVFVSIVVVVLIVAIMFWKQNRLFWDGLILIIGGAASAMVMIVSPSGTDAGRTYLGAFLLLLIGMMLLIPRDLESQRGLKCLYLCVVSVMTILCFFSVARGIQESNVLNNQLRARYSYIARSKAKEVWVEPVFYKNNNYSLSTAYAEVTSSKNSQVFPNNCYHVYFDKIISLKNKE